MVVIHLFFRGFSQPGGFPCRANEVVYFHSPVARANCRSIITAPDTVACGTCGHVRAYRHIVADPRLYYIFAL